MLPEKQEFTFHLSVYRIRFISLNIFQIWVLKSVFSQLTQLSGVSAGYSRTGQPGYIRWNVLANVCSPAGRYNFVLNGFSRLKSD
jgi:hypothetical protein